MSSHATSFHLCFPSPITRSLCLVAALSFLVLTTGCPGGKKKNEVTGKVTLDGKAVAGTVVFIGSDGKELMTLIRPDGSYTIVDPPAGEVKIKITGPLGIAAPGKDQAPAVGGMETGVPPPAKYASPDNGLKLTVTGGKQTYDIPLTK